MRVILLTGKGGVGKTSHALATALACAEQGHRVFLLSSDPAHSLSDAWGQRIGGGPTRLAPGLVAQEVSPLEELERSWTAIQRYLRRLLKEGTDSVLSEELLVFPGLEELVALRAVREVERAGESDVCIVDCAPTGATLRMLRFPDALRIFMENFFEFERKGARLLRSLRRNPGPSLVPDEDFFCAFERLYQDVEDVRQLLLDNDRTSARLVVNPARVIVEETRRSFAYLSLYGVHTDAVIANRLLPEAAAEGYFARWAAKERDELAAIRASFPLPLLRANLRHQEVRGERALRDLGREIYGEGDPADFLSRGRPLRFVQRGERSLLAIDVPGVSKEEVSVHSRGSDLLVRVRDAERWIALPDSVAGRNIKAARLEGGVLEVHFGNTA